jgi:threonine dehydrogenase-like Zn-dependent dehydrogenase
MNIDQTANKHETPSPGESGRLAIQITQPGEIQLVNIPQPALQPGEVSVRICYVGFCGSDLNTYSGKNALAKMPVIPGHEIGGVIDAVGENVPAHLVPGTACTINPYTACGSCPSCRNGRPNACRFNQTLGVQRDGAMREYMAVPWSKVIADADISPRDFCMVEPMSVGFHAVDRGRVTDLDVVMVLGCGMIGVGAVVRSALRGARVIAVDVDNDKLELAKRLGAAFTINSQTENIHERLQAITNNCGPDVIIEAVGASATYRVAVSEAAFTGRVVCIGYAKNDVTFETGLFVQKELDIRGSRNAMPEDFRAVMEYMKKGSFPKEEIISGVYPPAKAREALEKWKANPGKVFRILIEF